MSKLKGLGIFIGGACLGGAAVVIGEAIWVANKVARIKDAMGDQVFDKSVIDKDNVPEEMIKYYDKLDDKQKESAVKILRNLSESLDNVADVVNNTIESKEDNKEDIKEDIKEDNKEV